MEGSHPIISLVAFVDSDIDESLVEAVRQATGSLAAERDDWLLGAPEFIDETDPDRGVRTVGATLAMYAAFDPAGRLLDQTVDRRQFDEARAFVSAFQPVSERYDVDLGFELDGESVGWIEEGTMTEGLRRGLLEAWGARFA